MDILFSEMITPRTQLVFSLSRLRTEQILVSCTVVTSALYMNAEMDGSNIFAIIKSKTVTRGNINPKDIWIYLPKSIGSKNRDYGNRFVNIIYTRRTQTITLINIQEQSLQKPFTKYGRRIKIKKAGIKSL